MGVRETGMERRGPAELVMAAAVAPADREECLQAGVVGEIAGRFFDLDGRIIDPPLSGRIVTIGADELRAIPEVIGIVSGRPKAAAVGAALRGGLVNALVVDVVHADALLAEVGAVD